MECTLSTSIAFIGDQFNQKKFQISSVEAFLRPMGVEVGPVGSFCNLGEGVVLENQQI